MGYFPGAFTIAIRQIPFNLGQLFMNPVDLFGCNNKPRVSGCHSLLLPLVFIRTEHPAPVNGSSLLHPGRKKEFTPFFASRNFTRPFGAMGVQVRHVETIFRRYVPGISVLLQIPSHYDGYIDDMAPVEAISLKCIY
jgi:hypothetical protein